MAPKDPHPYSRVAIYPLGLKQPYSIKLLTVASRFGLLRVQKRTKWKFLTPPWNRHLAGLVMGPKKIIFPLF